MNINSNQTDTCTNHLIDEKSPYLLQHAHNPVNWYPWSDEAFQKAHAENKPIFLSIGYSTCHWCHVMAHESFEDDEVAQALNNDFISVKVDREERPDIDQIYMSFCQATTGSGGWPLTVFLTPDKKPFYVGTYYPKRSKYGNPGLLDILSGISEKWYESQNEIENSAEKMTQMLNNIDVHEPKDFKKDVFDKAYQYFARSFDPKYGGFGKAPKFPTPHNLLFLLRYYKAFEQPHAIEMVERTLLQMYKGGIFDHIGYGFSRYSTDEKWLAPHFEKMLYDNALLLMTYTETYQATRSEVYLHIAEKIVTYVLRDLKSEEGGFYCAEDADSEGVEGKFYLWSMDEVVEILGEDRAEFFCKYYPMTEAGNFEGQNILNLINTSLTDIEENSVIKEKLGDMAFELFHQREKRIHPHKDDKILTSWNGLMIAALAKAGKVFNNIDYVEYAKQAMTFIEEKLTRDDGRLFARYREGEVKNLGYLEDYAFTIWGYVELYEATFHTAYLEKALALVNEMTRLFEDDNHTGFFLYGQDAEQLIARPKELYDGALPSGNSVAAYLLLKLAKMTGQSKLEEIAEGMFSTFAGRINEAPMAFTMMLTAKLFNQQPVKEIVLAGQREDMTIRGMIDLINSKFMPFTVVLLNHGDGELDKINTFTSNQVKLEGRSTAYVCENFTCQQPVIDVDAFAKLIH